MNEFHDHSVGVNGLPGKLVKCERDRPSSGALRYFQGKKAKDEVLSLPHLGIFYH